MKFLKFQSLCPWIILTLVVSMNIQAANGSFSELSWMNLEFSEKKLMVMINALLSFGIVFGLLHYVFSLELYHRYRMKKFFNTLYFILKKDSKDSKLFIKNFTSEEWLSIKKHEKNIYKLVKESVAKTKGQNQFLHVKLKSNNQYVIFHINTKSQNIFHELIDHCEKNHHNQSSLFNLYPKNSLSRLKDSVEKVGGEIIYEHTFNTSTQIDSHNLITYIPAR